MRFAKRGEGGRGRFRNKTRGGKGMQAKQDMLVQAEECAQRAGFYRYLSRLFYKEVDEDLLAAIERTQPVLPLTEGMDETERAFTRGSNKMVKCAAQRNADTLTQSRCDYARVFLGAGSTADDPVSPFESVYTSEDHLLMQGSRDEMFRILIEAGLAIDDDFNMPEDHISFEFQYLAHLLDVEAAACESGDAKNVEAAHEASMNFFAAHIANWVPSFCEAAGQLAKTSFYRGLAECAAAWVAMEAQCYRGSVEGFDANDLPADAQVQEVA